MDTEIDITEIKLETERLLLRAWREDDLHDFFEYASVDGVGEMAGWKHHESIEATRDILRSFIAKKSIFALELKENGKVIGSLGIHGSWVEEVPAYAGLSAKEIGYVLSRDYWGRGLMPEAVKALIDYCFGALDLDALTCAHFLSNSQSKRVIEKCGFTFVKEDKYYSRQLGITYDENKYILLNPRGQNSGV